MTTLLPPQMSYKHTESQAAVATACFSQTGTDVIYSLFRCFAREKSEMRDNPVV